MTWIIIDSEPAVGFYDDESERQHVPDLSFRRLSSVSPFRRPLGPDAEGANVSATLDNGDGRLTALFADPPLRALVTMGSGGVLRVVGVLAAVSGGAEIALSIEA